MFSEHASCVRTFNKIRIDVCVKYIKCDKRGRVLVIDIHIHRIILLPHFGNRRNKSAVPGKPMSNLQFYHRDMATRKDALRQMQDYGLPVSEEPEEAGYDLPRLESHFSNGYLRAVLSRN